MAVRAEQRSLRPHVFSRGHQLTVVFVHIILTEALPSCPISWLPTPAEAAAVAVWRRIQSPCNCRAELIQCCIMWRGTWSVISFVTVAPSLTPQRGPCSQPFTAPLLLCRCLFHTHFTYLFMCFIVPNSQTHNRANYQSARSIWHAIMWGGPSKCLDYWECFLLFKLWQNYTNLN